MKVRNEKTKLPAVNYYHKALILDVVTVLDPPLLVVLEYHIRSGLLRLYIIMEEKGNRGNMVFTNEVQFLLFLIC